MLREDYDRFCAFCVVADLYYEALNTKDRAGWLMLARISKRISQGPWHFFDWKRGQDNVDRINR